MLDRIADGRTDLVFEFLAQGGDAHAKDRNGVSLIQWCAYYGDVSAIRFLLDKGVSLDSLGDNFDLNGAAFHGHWQLCQFLIERGADVNRSLPDTGETPLHATLCTTDRLAHDRVLTLLLANGADPNCVTRAGAETGGFMRDCRTKGETPLHRAAAFGTEQTIQLLLDAAAKIDAKDANGDTPLSWASWYLRPDAILRRLCYGDFHIRPERKSMKDYLQGEPHLDQVSSMQKSR
ncbi:MAG TPA: ankyrin repeat domain-containing protein [Terriglobales bacterium]